MKILAIETSCDDTCVALIEAVGKKQVKLNILSNVVSSQNEIHQKWGGIYPLLAKREHQRNLPLVLRKALKQGDKQGLSRIDAIAVTVGPGLEPCLWTGVNFAKGLAHNWNLPIIPINHIEAHIAANLVSVNYKSQIAQPRLAVEAEATANYKNLFPAICLVVSGGHTQLILMRDFGKYKILGETRDDAAGECFDKTARILGLGYPGGPAIAATAAKFSIHNFQFSIKLPRPMIYQKNYDFSFSGLKTAVLYKAQSTKRKALSEKFIQAMCQEIQQAIIDVLLYKTLRAAKDYNVQTIILGGGVIANKELQKQFKKKIKKEIPNSKLCIPAPNMRADNAVMIGITGYFLWLKKEIKIWKNIKAKANLRI